MKKLIALVTAFLLILPFGAAFAKEGEPQNEKKPGVRQQIMERRQEAKQAHERNAAVRTEIKAKITEIKGIAKELKGKEDEQSKATLTKIREGLKAISEDREALKELKGTGRPYHESLKANIKDKNIEGAVASLNSIIKLRNTRYEYLVKINTGLDSILSSIK